MASAVAASESEGKKKMSSRVEAVMLPASMVLVQVFTIGALLLSKLALDVGMEPFVLLAYRNLIGAVAVAPFAFYLERDVGRQVNLRVWGWVSVNALFGIVLAMGLHYYGLRASNAAYSANFLNLIPVVTFLIAVLLRAERLAARTAPGRMKMVGTAICVSGTMVVTLYKGRLLHPWPTRRSSSSSHHHNSARTDMVAGTLFLSGSCLAYALWFIVQARVGKLLPSSSATTTTTRGGSRYFTTMLACLSGAAQAAAIAAVVHRGRWPAAWAVAWDLRLVTVVYSGVFNTGVTFCLISWAVDRRGPTYPSMFNSLSLVATTVLDSLLLGTPVSVGSLLGALLIVVGLYAFLWGKNREIVTATNQQPQQQTTVAAGGEDESNGV